MKKLPYGISDFKRVQEDGYYFVDKTKHIETLESLESFSMFLRPRRFGKSLFLAVLEAYYDINYAPLFNTLFKDTYIGKNPTKAKNSYHI